jgi:gliding motility-associated-like protein
MKGSFFILCVFLLAFLFCTHKQTNAQQNLVFNGDFEIYSECPPENYYSPLLNYFEYCTGWFARNACQITPDFFHVCNNDINGVVGIPNNFWGYQHAYSGEGYVGICISDEILEEGVSEFIQTKLIESLKRCHQYEISFYVSLADKSATAFSRLGCVVTVDTLKGNSAGANCYENLMVTVTPSFVANQGFLADTVNWVLVSGLFTANGGEQFLTIGLFSNEGVNGDSMFIQTPVPSHQHAYGYYYIDYVTLYEAGIDENCNAINSLFIPNIFSPNGDGENDVLFVRGEYIEHIEFAVYDRWGTEVFRCNDIHRGWDGTYKGAPCHTGVYAYYVIAQFTDGEQLTKKGTVTLVR